MRTHIAKIAVVFFCLAASSLYGQKSPVVPEEVWQALANEISGDIAFDHVRYLTQFHSPNAASEGFRQSMEWLATKAREVGLEDVEKLSQREATRGWTVRAGEAWILEPFELKLGDVRETPLRVATNSHSADVTAELIDVGGGTAESDYEGKDVEGRIVLADGDPSAVHEMAVWKHGAAGVISLGSRRTSFPDQLPWRFLPEKSEDDEPARFAWILTVGEGERLRARVNSGENEKPPVVKARVTIDAEFSESTEGILEGWIRGTEAGLPSIVLVAHLQEEKTSANDNRSGCANLLEIGRALVRSIRDGRLARPRRDIRFWWVDEIRAPYQYFAENLDASRSILVAFNQDMVGAKLSLGPRAVVMSRTPFSRPSFLNDVAESVLETVIRGNTPFPFSRGNTDEGSFSRPLVSTLGTREPFRAMAVPYYTNTDHLVFNDGRIGIPAVSLNNWPDPYIHSSDDDLWQVDPTQMQRNAFVVAATAYFVASAGESDMNRLAALMFGGAQTRLARDSAAALLRLGDESAGPLASRYKDAVLLMEAATERELGAIDSALVFTSRDNAGGKLLMVVRERTETLARNLKEDLDQYVKQGSGEAPEFVLSDEEKEARKRVPEWAMPLAESLTKLRETDRVRDLHPVYATEVRNLIDGKRSAFDIYRTVRAASLSAGEWYYGPVELGKVAEVLEAAEKVGAVRFKTQP